MTKRKAGRKPASPLAVRAWRENRPKAISPLALSLGISQPAVSRWRQVPEERLKQVAVALGIPCERLRPDLYPSEPWSSL